MTGPQTLGADRVLGWTRSQQDEVRAWLAEAVGEQTMKDTYEVEIVSEGRITVRYFVRDTEDSSQFGFENGELVRAELTVDWPKPPPRW